MLVVGTRPEAIKVTPLAEALATRGIGTVLAFTGQHPALDPASFGLDSFPSRHLGCPGVENPHRHVRNVTKALLPLLGGANLLMVQGDTSSALAGALAAKFAGTPLAHVEAGLRSHDRRRPWPEEEFRIAIDSHSDLLFAATELSASNLRRERVRGRVYVTGNTGIDAALRSLRSISEPSDKGDGARLLVTCHRRESWGDGLASITAALRKLAQAKIASIEFILHPNPLVAAQIRLLLDHQPGIRLLSPCSHGELLKRMLQADLVLSDSGGIQEEAAALGVPLVVLRDRTERPEGIATGNLALGGLDPDRIVRCVTRSLSERRSDSPAAVYGDGRAAERIAAIVADWLDENAIAPAEEQPVYERSAGGGAGRRLTR